MMKNLGGMMKKMQEVQARLEALNTEMESRIFSASVGGGAVTVNLTGKGRIDSIKIAPELCQEDEVETLEELVALAVNTAKSEARLRINRHWKRLPAACHCRPAVFALLA